MQGVGGEVSRGTHRFPHDEVIRGDPMARTVHDGSRALLRNRTCRRAIGTASCVLLPRVAPLRRASHLHAGACKRSAAKRGGLPKKGMLKIVPIARRYARIRAKSGVWGGKVTVCTVSHPTPSSTHPLARSVVPLLGRSWKLVARGGARFCFWLCPNFSLGLPDFFLDFARNFHGICPKFMNRLPKMVQFLFSKLTKLLIQDAGLTSFCYIN